MVRGGVVVAAVALASGVAWADRDVAIERGKFVVRVPDEWTSDQLALKEGIVLERPGEKFVGSIEILRDTDCAAMKRWALDKHRYPLTAYAARDDGWEGYFHGVDNQNLGAHCREVTTSSGTVVFWVESLQADTDRVLGIAAGAQERSVSAAPAATGTHVIALTTTNLKIIVPASWSATVVDGFDSIVDGGREIGKVILQRKDCDALLAQAGAGIRSVTPRTEFTDWKGIQGVVEDGSTQALFCRPLPINGGVTGSILVGSYDSNSTMILVYAVSASLAALGKDRDKAPEVTPSEGPPKRTLADLISPSVYEAGLFLPRTADPPLECTPCFGGLVAMARSPWQNDVLAWSYRGRLAGASGGGSYGTLEAGIGLGKVGELWSIAVQGLAGYGYGLNAPGTTHYGYEGALRFLSRERHIGVGFGVSYAKIYRDDGDGMRFRIDFIGAGRRLGLTAGFGYERLLTADVITLNFSVLRLPLL